MSLATDPLAFRAAFRVIEGGKRQGGHPTAWEDLVTFLAERRLLAEWLIDTLIERLDQIDGDPDLEDSGDAEPVDEREPDDEGDDLDLGEAGDG